MAANPADIAKYTTDGVVLTQNNPATKASHPNSIDAGDSEIEMFFNDAAAGAAMLRERFLLLGLVGRIHDAIEIDESLGLGTLMPVAPVVPQFQIIDDSRTLNARVALRAYSFDMTSDRYGLELAGTIGKLVKPWTADSTGQPTADDTSRTADEL